MIPGTGEYALAVTPVTVNAEDGETRSANVSTPAGKSDFSVSLETLTEELPNLQAAALVGSWVGSDLRCSECRVQPKVESAEYGGQNMPWSVAGVSRSGAEVIAQNGGRPIYGGTPTDRSVIEAIQAMRAAQKAVMFYPFILMDQQDGNSLPDPYSEATTQPALPWRGRITLSKAPGQAGSPDGTAAAEAEVDAFFGTVTAADFVVNGETVSYSGPQEWTLSRFILHYAALCQAAGGVEAFCIGSEMRGITQIRAAGDQFVAVARLRALAAEARQLLGAQTKISYAADWSEYYGYQPQDGSGDRLFHLDAFWADANVDFIGIDNYMPLSDWRDGPDHRDAAKWSAIYDLDYLRDNIEGGEGYDWYSPTPEARVAQRRVPITDGVDGEHWIYRYKDIRNWWRNTHHDRINGVRQLTPTDWQPQSKPIWFTEYGCAAVDKGTNQPNKFLDPKSSESDLPKFSSGARDDLMQMQYLRALSEYWDDGANNPTGSYGGPMVATDRKFVWAWDARPYPFFPGNSEVWSDGDNYARGHWLNGRVSTRALSAVIKAICAEAGVTDVDVSEVYGLVRGYALEGGEDARAALQPLLLAHGVDAIEKDGTLFFRQRNGLAGRVLDAEELAEGDSGALVSRMRLPEAETSGRVRLAYVEADGDYRNIAEESVLPDEETHAGAESEIPILMTRPEGRQSVERWLSEARVGRDTVRFALPLSQNALGAGDVVDVPSDTGRLKARIDRVEQTTHQLIEGVRIEPEVYHPADFPDDPTPTRRFVPTGPVSPLFLDLPLLRGDEVPHAPYLAVSANPWPGNVAVYDAPEDAGYELNGLVTAQSTVVLC